MKVLIVGGVAGGATAAARLRRLNEDAQIIVLERSGFISYANCGLPYYIGGVISEESALTLQTPESFGARFGIEVRVQHEATALDTARKVVTVQRLADHTFYEESYDKLILSPGAKPFVPGVPGIDDSRIFTLRNVEDTLRIKAFIKRRYPQRAVVIGGGFIGLEMAENLCRAGVSVTLVERAAQVLAPLDYDMACGVHAYLRGRGINLMLNQSVSGFTARENSVQVQLDGGGTLDACLVLLAAGVTPETTLAKQAGLLCNAKGSIVVNDRMETSASHVYAVGDAIEVRHFVSGQPTSIPLAGPANKQARVAADNIAGYPSRFAGTQGSSILKLFDLVVASTGLNERAAQQAKIAYETVITFSPSHATYYPGASNMTIKTLFAQETGRLLGAQIVGFEGVDKRIDVLATALRAGMDADNLAALELSYAPPFSSAKDPVNMAGFVMQNVRQGLLRQFYWHEVQSIAQRTDVTFVDTRTPEEFAGGHIEGAINLPLDSLRNNLHQLDARRTLFVYCHSGLRSYIACRILMQNGFQCRNLAGGYRFYESVVASSVFDAAAAHACGVKISS